MARPRYDVALSFASEQRPFVRAVANHLRDASTSLFFDEFEQLSLWGKDLVEELDRVYRKDSRLVVMFISEAYKRKHWTSHERRSALAAALRRREYVLPVRFDDTDLDGLPDTVSYLDARKITPAALGPMIIEKLRLHEQSYEVGVEHLEAWRLVGSRFAGSAFLGEGAKLFGGRWTRPGTRAVYTANSVCVALLETFAFLGQEQLQDLVAVKARIALSTDIKVVRTVDLPARWRAHPPGEDIRAIGTDWAASGETCVLAVPSVVLPSEQSYLLNPDHPDFGSLVVLAEQPVGDLARFLTARS